MQNTKLICMDSIESEEVKWLWKPYIPESKLTILRGNPGEGKTMLILNIISRLTTGKALPGDLNTEVRPPSVCIYQTAEDGLADTIKPRLVANLADCKNVFVIDESNTPLSFSDERIESAIRDKGAKLLVLDPLQAYLGSGVDMYRANEVRPQFTALMGVAERTGCAIVIIEHMNKMKGMKAINKGIGSMDITGAARSVLLLAKPKATESTMYLAPIKNNLAAPGATLVFSVEDNRMFFDGTSEMSADQLLESSSGDDVVLSKIELAEQKLLELFSKQQEWEALQLQDGLKHLDISKRTLDEAKKNLGIKSVKRETTWYWTMPNTEGKYAN